MRPELAMGQGTALVLFAEAGSHACPGNSVGGAETTAEGRSHAGCSSGGQVRELCQVVPTTGEVRSHTEVGSCGGPRDGDGECTTEPKSHAGPRASDSVCSGGRIPHSVKQVTTCLLATNPLVLVANGHYIHPPELEANLQPQY